MHPQADDDYQLARSLSQPSLARSGSELTEHWALERGQSPTSPRPSAASGRLVPRRPLRRPAPPPPGMAAATAGMQVQQSSESRQGGNVSPGGTETQFQASRSSYVAQSGWFAEQ